MCTYVYIQLQVVALTMQAMFCMSTYFPDYISYMK